MLSLSRGQKQALPDGLLQRPLTFTLKFQNPANLVLDAGLFGVDAQDQLSDDRYFCFFNQPESPEKALKLLPAQGSETARFQVELSRLPETIHKLVFTVSIDGHGTMKDLPSGSIELHAEGQVQHRFEVSGSDFDQEKAVILLEVYRKNGWRMGAVGQGFSGGLADLLKAYGGQEAEETPPPPPAPKVQLNKAVDLEKKVQSHPKGQKLVSLVKTVNGTLEKKGLSDLTAAVVMAMDATGSMQKAYRSGLVQSVVDRLGVLAMRLDDDGKLETWFHCREHLRTPDITLDTLDGYVARTVLDTNGKFVQPFGSANNEPPIMKALIERHKNSRQPVLIVFISDGGVKLSGEIRDLIVEAAHFPIFWMFVGLAGQNYGVLEKLDDLPNRVVDNADFFAIDDLEHITDEELYGRLLNEFPGWLGQARRQNIVQ